MKKEAAKRALSSFRAGGAVLCGAGCCNEIERCGKARSLPGQGARFLRVFAFMFKNSRSAQLSGFQQLLGSKTLPGNENANSIEPTDYRSVSRKYEREDGRNGEFADEPSSADGRTQFCGWFICAFESEFRKQGRASSLKSARQMILCLSRRSFLLQG